MSLAQLARWHSSAGAALAVWIGGRLAGASWGWQWLHPMSVAFLLAAAGNAWNDAGDVAADQLNRASRPIPRGAVSVAGARAFAVACAAVALALALPLGMATIAGTMAAIILVFLYTPHLKGIPLLGNAVVGLLTGACTGFGGLVAGDVPAVVLPAAALGLLFGGREVLKTLYDLPGDRAVGAVTATSRWGAMSAIAFAVVCFVFALVMLALWAGAALGRWPVPLLTLFLVLSTILPLWRNPADRAAVHRALTWSKVAGLGLLVLFAIGG